MSDMAEFVTDYLAIDPDAAVRDVAIGYVDTFMAYDGTSHGGDSQAWFWAQVEAVQPQLAYYVGRDA
jgi:hypothetical protein